MEVDEEVATDPRAGPREMEAGQRLHAEDDALSGEGERAEASWPAQEWACADGATAEGVRLLVVDPDAGATRCAVEDKGEEEVPWDDVEDPESNGGEESDRGEESDGGDGQGRQGEVQEGDVGWVGGVDEDVLDVLDDTAESGEE
eukprot:2134703-Prymnesium_polylepis.1